MEKMTIIHSSLVNLNEELFYLEKEVNSVNELNNRLSDENEWLNKGRFSNWFCFK